MDFIDKHYEKFNNSVGEHNLTISRLEFAKLLGVFSKHEQQLHRYKQAIEEIEKIAEQQVPYTNLDQVKTCMEVEFDYAGKVWNLEQRMSNILQKIAE